MARSAPPPAARSRASCRRARSSAPRLPQTASTAYRRRDCLRAGPRAGELPPATGKAEQPRLDARRRPRVPMADEELIVDAGAAGVRLFRQASAIEVGAPEVAVGPDDDFVTRWRKLEPANGALEALTWTGAPPIGMRNNWSWSLTPIRNQIASSGPNTASWPFSAALTSCGAAPGLVRSSRYRRSLRLFFARSVSEMVNTAQRPSRESSGAPRRCIMCMSVAVIGREESGAAEARQRRRRRAARSVMRTRSNSSQDGEGDRRSWWRGPRNLQR